ncbi:Tetratricopeptide TPR_1 repeat-containing protein [Russula earlei]|uniref:Tetratricopeptide TPR_1 repeat-containing protein n=1 Tax=Russula earlei TaxID=71964 RepID=A0ACC0U3T3_9AGAM|nr:Tetratricopeptide TPR_1 repeat-containing protein [Russula earlei]
MFTINPMLRKLPALLFLLCITICGRCTNYFSALESVPTSGRYIAACKIYHSEIARLDSTEGVAALGQLKALADKENDKQLEVGYLELMGDFYKELYRGNKAIDYLKRAISLAITYKMKDAQADAYTNLGWVYYNINRDYPLAFENMLKANNLIQNEIGYDHYLFSSQFLYGLGFLYYDFGNISKAKYYLLDAMKYPCTNQVYEIRISNTLALTYENTKQYDSAVYFFQKVIRVAKNSHNEAWVGIATGNLGNIYFLQKKYEEALPLLTIDYETSKKNGQWMSSANALATIADINVKNNHLTEAGKQLTEVLQLYNRQKDIVVLRGYYNVMVRLCKAQKNYYAALAYVDSTNALQSEIIKRNDAIIFNQAEQKVELEKHLVDIKLLESEADKKMLIKNFIIVSVILLLIIAIQFLFRLYLKRKEYLRVIDNAKMQLNNYLESIKEKNELIEQFKEEIEHLNSLPEYVLQKEKEELTDKLKKYTILTENHWNEFRHLLDKVHNGFFEKLKLRYPNLTQAETRLLALMKLNLSRKEIAEMLGVSIDTVRKTRQRIQHKIELPEDQQLEDIVVKL